MIVTLFNLSLALKSKNIEIKAVNTENLLLSFEDEELMLTKEEAIELSETLKFMVERL